MHQMTKFSFKISAVRCTGFLKMCMTENSVCWLYVSCFGGFCLKIQLKIFNKVRFYNFS